MEINFRLNENGKAVTINVPAGVGFTIKVNPVGGLAPWAGGGLKVNGAHVHPPAGGVKEEYESVLPKFSDLSLEMANPKVFFDMTVDGEPAGRIVMELFADTVPRTAENFRALCTGEKGMGKLGKPLHYKGSIIHSIQSNHIWIGGDFTSGNGSGGESIYGDKALEEENFNKKHTGPGILSMNDNGSQFIICMTKNEDLDGECVVFGQVVQGLDLIRSIEKEVATRTYKPSKPIVIADCGQIS